MARRSDGKSNAWGSDKSRETSVDKSSGMEWRSGHAYCKTTPLWRTFRNRLPTSNLPVAQIRADSFVHVATRRPTTARVECHHKSAAAESVNMPLVYTPLASTYHLMEGIA
jgi:hypothetical protein